MSMTRIFILGPFLIPTSIHSWLTFLADWQLQIFILIDCNLTGFQNIFCSLLCTIRNTFIIYLNLRFQNNCSMTVKIWFWVDNNLATYFITETSEQKLILLWTSWPNQNNCNLSSFSPQQWKHIIMFCHNCPSLLWMKHKFSSIDVLRKYAIHLHISIVPPTHV